MSHKVIQPEGWAPAKGYANGMLTPDGTLYIGGQIGWTADLTFERHDFIGQMEQALENIIAVVEAAGGKATDVVRLTWFVTNKKTYVDNQRAVGKAYQKYFGKHFPAMSMLVVSELVEDEALVEIEATAVLAN
ncbi:endoribonuclease L-PSP [Roseibium sp. TrichSKD4]|uniref:RidA family protein n=1 Tax=Roseibium sp. TrichSKD4 TaxID=744980 RepID=UPI0001E57370|nr:RidA family protein [Roseibium sp. TrichSKD4]EFO29802.1 endoribonuclease L-PSP [Roseibium sp. TrichSKD4]